MQIVHFIGFPINGHLIIKIQPVGLSVPYFIGLVTYSILHPVVFTVEGDPTSNLFMFSVYSIVHFVSLAIAGNSIVHFVGAEGYSIVIRFAVTGHSIVYCVIFSEYSIVHFVRCAVQKHPIVHSVRIPGHSIVHFVYFATTGYSIVHSNGFPIRGN